MERSEAVQSWQELGAVAPAGLAEARLQLHWAAQVLASAARQLLEARPDDSHTGMAWVDGRLATQQFTDGRRLALEPATLTLAVLRPDGAPDEELPLAGAGLGDAMRWASERVAGGWGLRLPEYEMPDHAVRSGGRFATELAPFQELARWYAGAAAVLEHLRSRDPAASAVRCWPHHFDIATLVALDPEEKDAEKARSIGLGLSPGDGTVPEPYFYVLPWPKPDEHDLPDLARGGWHTEGFVAGVLRAAEVVASGDAAAQAKAALEFLESGLAESRRLLGAG